MPMEDMLEMLKSCCRRGLERLYPAGVPPAAMWRYRHELELVERAGTAGGLRPDLAGSKVPHEKENAKEKSTPGRCGDGGGFVMGVRRAVKNNAR